MTAEYFAPREDVILQNEAPSDFYILVTGSVVNKQNNFCFLAISSRSLTEETRNR